MNADNFELQFSKALAGSSREYLEARQALIEMGAAAVPRLRAQAGQGEWRARLAARSILGWITERPLFEECTARVKGKTDSPVPSITGRTPGMVRIKAVERLGPAVVPRLVEMLILSRDYADTDEIETIFAALSDFRDLEMLEPLKYLVREGDPRLRAGAADALGRLGDPRAVEVLAPVLQDRHAELALRMAAATALARLNAPPAVKLLQTILADDSEPIELRRLAAYLGRLLGPAAAPALADTLRTTADEELLVNALNSLGRIGAASALPAVSAAERKFSTGPVSRAAREAHQAIEQRAAHP